MSWEAHVDFTVTRVNKILWQLTRFKQLGANREKLTWFYVLKIRSILMFGAVCFHSGLNLDQRHRLELQQKRSLAIILGTEYVNYEHARRLVNLPDLERLREEACLKWARKAQAHPKHSHLFPKNTTCMNTRHKRPFREYLCKSARYFNSAVPSMARALNRNSV